MAYTQTTQDLTAALTTRLNELGHAMSPSHVQALVADILNVCGVTDNANVASHTATDTALLEAPAHNKF